jgi:DNA repair exonuclease SbcCD ATPase subunit
MKKIILGIVLGMFVSGLVIGATEYFKNMIVSPDVVYINGEKLDMSDREFELQNALDNDTDRTYVPLRKVAEITGCEVVWDGANDRIDITSPDIKELTRLKEIIKELESKNSSLENENKSLKKKITKLITNQMGDNEIINNLTNEINELKSIIESLTYDNNNLQAIIGELSNENALLKEEIGSLKDKNTNLSNENDSLRSDNANLLNENNSLKEENSSLRNDNDNLSNENKSLKDDNASLKDDNANLLNKNAELQSIIDSLTKENSKLQSIINTLTQDNTKLKSTIDTLTKDNIKLQSIIDSLTKENKELKDALLRLSVLRPLIDKQGGCKEAYSIHSNGYVEEKENANLFNLLKAIYNQKN